jgi:tripartite-type tricarboxylate transporter receptor subunit TctC
MRIKKAALAALVAGLSVASTASAQFPTKPVRIVVPYSAGGPLELMVRPVADHLTIALKQPVLIDNRPGGGTTIGAAAVAQAPADGHMLFLNASSYLINAQLMPNLPYDPQKDLIPVTLASSTPHVLVVFPGLGTATLKDFLAVAKSKGNSLSYASFGNGSSGHLAFELLKKTYGFDMLHVAYKGVPQAAMDVMGGRLQAMIIDLSGAVPHIKGGKLNGLAIAADRRSHLLPDVPTFEQASGTRFVSRSWFGFMVRAGTPAETIKVLNQEIVQALQKPEVKDKLRESGIDTYGTTPAEFATFMKSESDRFAEAIKFSGAKFE